MGKRVAPPGPPGTRWCKVCEKHLPECEFNPTQLGLLCREHLLAQNLKRYHETKHLTTERRGQRSRANYRKYREEALAHYGGKCECCGEARYEFLVFDHIEGGGWRRRENGTGERNIVSYLRRNGHPKGFRILCHNCNQSIGILGYCPHHGHRPGTPTPKRGTGPIPMDKGKRYYPPKRYRKDSPVRWCRYCEEERPREEFDDRYREAVCIKHFKRYRHDIREWQGKEMLSSRASVKYRETKEQIIAAYGGGCSCCGENEYAFLNIDHVDGRKGEPRLNLVQFMRGIIRDGFPSDFRIPCANCNAAYAFHGTCPHQHIASVKVD